MPRIAAIKNNWRSLSTRPKKKQVLSGNLSLKPSINPKRVTALAEITRIEEEIRGLEVKIDKNKKERALLSSKLSSFQDKLSVLKDKWGVK